MPKQHMTRQHVLRVAVCRTMMKRVAMLILAVDGITTTIVWKHVRSRTILKVIVMEMMNVFGSTARMSVFRIVLRVTTMRHPVTLILDVDGTPRQGTFKDRFTNVPDIVDGRKDDVGFDPLVLGGTSRNSVELGNGHF